MKSLLEKIERKRIEELHFYPGNAKRGDVPSIMESLEENEQAAPVIVQKSTNFIIAGNHTVMAAKEAGWDEIDVCVIDVDDRRALKLNLALNRTSDKGSYDASARAELLALLEGDYEGTGYDLADIEKFTKTMEDLPEPGDADEEEPLHVWGVIITCDGESEQTALLTRFMKEGLNVRTVML